MQDFDLKQLVLDTLEGLKGNEIICIDVTGLTQIMDYMIIASGTSNRHVKALARTVIEQASAAGIKPFGSEGFEDGEWILIDLVDVVVHLMLPAVREFYDLEGLWDLHSPLRDEGSVVEI